MSSADLTQKLFSDKRYDTKAEIAAQKIAEQTSMRHAQWIVSMKYVVDQSDVDSLLSLQGKYCDSVIFDEKERITENQRILLQCERQKVVERREQMEERQLVLDKVVKRVSVTTEKMMLERLQQMDVQKLLWGFPDFDHFVSFAYSASLNFSRLGTLATLSTSLSNSVLDLVSDDTFCKLLGKYPKQTNDAKVAIGYIGIDNCRRLFPVLMARPLLKWSDRNTRLIAPKIWQHAVVMANVTRMRLNDAGYKEPDEGVLIGVIRALSYFAVCNYFSQIFEDALISVMQDFRDNEQMSEYFACSEVTPTLSVMPTVLYKLDKQLTQKVVDHIEWSPRGVHLRNAIIEDIEQTPVLKRSLHGVALAQARAFSIYDTMKASNAFVDKHAPFWFANVQMDGVSLKSVKQSNPGKLTLSI